MSIDDDFVGQLPDTDPAETKEWLDSLDAVAKIAGPNRARFLMQKLLEHSDELALRHPAAGPHPVHQHDPDAGREPSGTGSPATSTSSAASGRSSAGTPR